MAIKVISWSIIGLFITEWVHFNIENAKMPKPKTVKHDSIPLMDPSLLMLAAIL